MSEDSTPSWLPSLTAGGHGHILRVMAWVAWEQSPMQVMGGLPQGPGIISEIARGKRYFEKIKSQLRLELVYCSRSTTPFISLA